MKANPSFVLRASALVLTLCAGVAGAQTTPAGGKVSSLGNAGAKATVMSRDELRACLKQQAELKGRSDEALTKRAALDTERKQLEVDNEALKVERDALVKKADQIAADNNAKVAAHAERVSKFNEKMDQLNAAMKRGDNVDRRRQLLEREGADIQKTSDDLNAQNVAVQASLAEDQKGLNAKFSAFEARIADWNQRNKAMDSVAAVYDDDMTSWKTRCGGRNYRESDFEAIRAGK